MTVPTTTFASWVNLTPGSSGTTPAAWVGDCLGDFVEDYDTAALIDAFMAELQRRLPAGLTILGNGELIGPASGPEYDALPENVIQTVAEIIGGDEDGMGGIDVIALAEEHDYTSGPYVIYARGVGGEERDDDPQLYTYDDRRTLAQAFADARDKYAATTGLPRDAILVEQMDENDPAVQDALDDTEDGPRPLDRGPATILRINALDLPHRLAINPNGAEFHIDGLEFDARSGQVVIQLTPYDENGEIDHEAGQVGVYTLSGWTIQ